MAGMKICVCVKQAPDSAATVRIRDDGRIDPNVPLSTSPYDLHAVEAAVELASTRPESEVVAISVGPEASAALQRALAMGADRAIHVLTDSPLDASATARGLAAAIERDGPPALILTGKSSIDQCGSQVMFRLSEHLGMQVVSEVVALAIEDDRVRVESEWHAGASAVWRLQLPCVLGVGKALNRPRDPRVHDLIRARRQGFEVVSWDRLGIEMSRSDTRVLKLRPAAVCRRGRLLEGDPEGAVRELVRALREEARVL